MTRRIESSISVSCPVHKVWDYVTRLDRMAEWAAHAVQIEGISDACMGAGTSFRTVHELEGVQVSSSHTVLEAQPPTKWRLKVHFKTPGVTTWRFVPEAVGTRVTASVEHDFGDRIRNVVEKELRLLKQVLEVDGIPDASRGFVGNPDLKRDAVFGERIEGSVHVDRSAQEIWDYMIQVDKIVEWAAGASDVVDVSDTPIRVGSTFYTVYPLDGEEVKGYHKVIEMTPPNTWRLKILYTIVGFTTWELGSENGETRATVRVEYNFNESGVVAVEKELSFLKQVLETGGIPDQSLRGKEQW